VILISEITLRHGLSYPDRKEINDTQRIAVPGDDRWTVGNEKHDIGSLYMS
jgi:hypothetical protein